MNDSIAHLYAIRLRYIRRKLEQYKGRWPEVATGSGVSIRTISKVARSEIKEPRNDIVDLLALYFSEQDRIAS